jgi:hypothetical protein
MAELFGKLFLVKPIQEISATFQKREFVLVTEEQFPQYIQLELHKDRVDIIESFSLGDSLKVFYNIKGNKWTNPEGIDKYFSTLQAWKIEKIHVAAPYIPPSVPPTQTTAFPEPIGLTQEEEDDLPF